MRDAQNRACTPRHWLPEDEGNPCLVSTSFHFYASRKRDASASLQMLVSFERAPFLKQERERLAVTP
jgi:hypothetical protein